MQILRAVGRFLMTMITGISVLLVIAVVLWAIAAIASRSSRATGRPMATPIRSHRMTDTPKITDEVAILAKQYLQDVALGKIKVNDKYEWNRFTASKTLYAAYQTQERYGSARIKELAQMPKPSQNVRDYEELDDDALNAKVVAIRGGRTG